MAEARLMIHSNSMHLLISVVVVGGHVSVWHTVIFGAISHVFRQRMLFAVHKRTHKHEIKRRLRSE